MTSTTVSAAVSSPRRDHTGRGDRFGESPIAHSVARVVALVVLIAGIALGAGASRAQAATDETALSIRTASATHAFVAEIADNDATRTEGLMYRTKMADDHGMLFDFRREQPVWFWMKNTYIPLDMIFVKSDGTILSIAENTTPLSEAAISSGGPVRFVFEVVAGTARRLAIRPGDHVLHSRMKPAE